MLGGWGRQAVKEVRGQPSSLGGWLSIITDSLLLSSVICDIWAPDKHRMALDHVVPNSAYTRLSHREPPNCLSLAAQVQLGVVMRGRGCIVPHLVL